MNFKKTVDDAYNILVEISGSLPPTGTLSGIKGSESKNYVVFDEDAIKIESLNDKIWSE